MTITPLLTRITPFLLSFVAGSFAALAMAPFNFWPVLFISLGGLYYLILRSNSLKAVFAKGWLFGFGYFVFGLYWIGNALLVEGNPFVWVYPLAIGGLPVLLAMFPAIAVTLSARFFRLERLEGYIAFCALYALFEWVRGHIFTGFPWNLFAYTWIDVLPVAQIVWLSDSYFLTWLTLLWAVLPAFIALWGARTPQKAALIAVIALIFGGVYAYGEQRLAQHEPEYHDNIRIRVVQPNIPQHEKWDGSRMMENFIKHVRLSYPEHDEGQTTYIVWPETAIGHIYATDPTAMGVITQALNSYSGKAYLFTGLLRRDTERGKIGNSLVMIDQEGQITNIYDKHHLVPFGEYIPFQRWIPVKPIVQFSGFTQGEGLMSMPTPEGLRYSPLVCYEVIFSNKAALRNAEERPDFIMNVTNDGWYGNSAGPRQHYVQTVFRAIEEGLPLIRSANTGISAVNTPVGEPLVEIALMTSGAKNSALPLAVAATPFHAAFKHYIFWIFIGTSLLLACFLRKIIKN